MTMVRNRPTELGAEFGAHLARFADDESAKRSNPPERCASCAFRAGTIPNGCETTLMDAMKCAVEHVDFLCHEDKKRERLCAGYLIMRTEIVGKCPWPFSDEIKDSA